jgi:AraC-like DNA-binding protein/quercetin dioxygenase-like cupin family protein
MCQAVQSVWNEHVYLTGPDAAFRVHYWGAMKDHAMNPVHKHSFVEICFVAGGDGVYMDDQTEYPLSSGSLFCSRPGVWHQIRSESGMFMMWVAFELVGSGSKDETIRLYRELLRTPNFYVKDGSDLMSSQMWKLLYRMTQENHYATSGTIAALAFSLISSFLHTFRSSPGGEKEWNVRHNPSKVLHQAKLFIRDNLSRPLHLSDVADYLHLSERHLSRLFSEVEGQTYISYVRQERIRQAVTLLKTTNHTIQQVAEETGFENVHYFTRVFKQLMGVPPGEYRRHRTDDD